jgi:hypothetical protein
VQLWGWWIQDEWGKRREEEVVVEVEEEKDTEGKKVWDTTTRAMEGWSEGVVDGEVEGDSDSTKGGKWQEQQKAEWKASVGEEEQEEKEKGKEKGKLLTWQEVRIRITNRRWQNERKGIFEKECRNE